MIGQAVSNFKIIDELGPAGPEGTFLARDTKEGRMVSLRLLPAELSGDAGALEKAFSEARAACRPSHPHICTVHGTGIHQGRPFVATEVAEGEPLSRRLARGPLEAEILLDFGVQIADALQAAHARGVVHGALEAGTVLVTEGDQIKVMEFGLGRLGRGAASGRTERDDLRALGRLLHAMATGRVAEGDGAGDDLPPVASLNPKAPAGLDAIINRAVGRGDEPAFGSAAELAESLSQAMIDAAPEYVPPPSAGDSDAPEPGEPEPQGWPWGLVAAVAVAAVALLLIVRACL